MTTLNDAELAQITSMRTQAQAGQIGYWQIYQWLADTLQTKGVSNNDQTVMWLRGATEANANRGAMAALIRTYTETQTHIRYGTVPSTGQMQAASNAVAYWVKIQTGQGDSFPPSLALLKLTPVR
jgi:hypothetical protein